MVHSIITIYLHGSKEGNTDLGQRIGLKGEALNKFMYACYEVKVDLRVNMETGDAEIIKIDDREFIPR